jgi:DNA-binding IclR family transcriptional regulator
MTPAAEPYPFRAHRSVADVDTGRQGLTPRAAKLLAYLREQETTPSYDEMRRFLGAGSKHTVHALVAQLVERGAVTVERYRNGWIKPHSLRVVDKRVNLGSVATADLVAELERRGHSRARAA